MCELPPKALSQIICDHCGKKATRKRIAGRESKKKVKEGGKTRPSRDSGGTGGDWSGGAGLVELVKSGWWSW